jgi:hypothetical protein
MKWWLQRRHGRTLGGNPQSASPAISRSGNCVSNKVNSWSMYRLIEQLNIMIVGMITHLYQNETHKYSRYLDECQINVHT